jgi:hypothetical protein
VNRLNNTSCDKPWPQLDAPKPNNAACKCGINGGYTHDNICHLRKRQKVVFYSSHRDIRLPKDGWSGWISNSDLPIQSQLC